MTRLFYSPFSRRKPVTQRLCGVLGTLEERDGRRSEHPFIRKDLNVLTIPDAASGTREKKLSSQKEASLKK